jgi:hypothetical protein
LLVFVRKTSPRRLRKSARKSQMRKNVTLNEILNARAKPNLQRISIASLPPLFHLLSVTRDFVVCGTRFACKFIPATRSQFVTRFYVTEIVIRFCEALGLEMCDFDPKMEIVRSRQVK